MSIARRILSRTHSHIDFAVAGQDAFVVVSFPLLWVKSSSNGICRFPHFLSRGIICSLQTLRPSKYVYLPRLEFSLFNLGMQEVTTFRFKYPKPLRRYNVLAVFGANIVASDGAEWKKYRKVTAPAFSEVCTGPEFETLLISEYTCQRNYKLVWHESAQIMLDLFDQVWGDRSEIVVDHCLDITLPVR